MAVKTFGSEEARNRFRAVMESVIAGYEVIVERYNQPAAVVVGYDKWQATLQRLHELELLHEVRRVKQGVANGEIGTISHDDLKRQLLERREHVAA
ncbi:MAG: type II toxin-antitoxin system Phd/YefM family antitoxin [Caldilineaceae bacterium]|nr:type II toxin-antitoxin system Phd/YefM family antitoxin [Caldilineaceae bacterium]